ncbi:MAG: single-stranded DNA-binding protein [Chromatiales bacterium]|nr:single-stranded DNA-binding protein [Chromatiales bacterium]
MAKTGEKSVYTPNVQISAFGRLVEDPVSRTTAEGHPFTTGRIACNVTPSKKGSEEQTWFLGIRGFRTIAQQLAKCSKGQPINIHGTLELSTWRKTPEDPPSENWGVVLDSVIGAATTKRTDSPNQE